MLDSFSSAEWLLFVLASLLMLGAIFAGHRRDEATLQAGFMPAWHRVLYRRRQSESRRDRALRALGLVMLWFAVSHYLLAPFFLLPYADLGAQTPDWQTNA